MIDWLGGSVAASGTVFVLCALVIGFAGTRLARVADEFADRSGFGEALTGGVLLGATTSLSGSVLSVSAAWHGRPELAMGNALGGIAVQTAFLALADIAYRRANLEHAAASTENLMQCALLSCLLAIILLGANSPDLVFWHVHPATLVLFGTYGFGLALVRRVGDKPMWRPRQTRETRLDEPDQRSFRWSMKHLITTFLLLSLTIGVAGWILERAAAGIAEHTRMSQTFIGVLLTSISTSLPELVTSIAAVRRGALTLAVSGIIGGNAFDTLFAAFSDIAYRDGSIYHAMSGELEMLLVVALLMSIVLQMGLIRREEHGIGGIGFESAAILGLYAASLGMMFLL